MPRQKGILRLLLLWSKECGVKTSVKWSEEGGWSDGLLVSPVLDLVRGVGELTTVIPSECTRKRTTRGEGRGGRDGIEAFLWRFKEYVWTKSSHKITHLDYTEEETGRRIDMDVGWTNVEVFVTPHPCIPLVSPLDEIYHRSVQWMGIPLKRLLFNLSVCLLVWLFRSLNIRCKSHVWPFIGLISKHETRVGHRFLQIQQCIRDFGLRFEGVPSTLVC